MAGLVSIFNGSFAKFLRQNLNLRDKVYILTGEDDPSVVAQDAPKGSLYMRYGTSGGVTYVKTDDGSSTSWLANGGNSPLTQPDGSATAPAYSFASDDETGMYLDAVSSLGFAANGVKVASFSDTIANIDVLLSANLGLKITGGAAATETIARTAADTLDLNNSAMILSPNACKLPWMGGSGTRIIAIDNAGSLVSALVGNVHVASDAAIAYSKLATLTADKALISSAGGIISTSATTSTQLAYLSAATGTTGTNTSNLVFSESPILSGNVIFGSDVPTASAVLPFRVIGGSGTGMELARFSENTLGPSLNFSKSYSDTLGTNVLPPTATNLFDIGGWAANGTTYNAVVGILAYIDGTTAVGDIPTRLDFRVSRAGTVSRQTRMSLSSRALTMYETPLQFYPLGTSVRKQILHNVASFHVNTGTTSGSYLITLPHVIASSSENTFVRVVIKGFDYNQHRTLELIVCGYLRSDTGMWTNYSVHNRGESLSISEVRLGEDASGKPVIILGTNSTTFAYASFTITEFEANWIGSINLDYSSGWTFTGPFLDADYTTAGIDIEQTVAVTTRIPVAVDAYRNINFLGGAAAANSIGIASNVLRIGGGTAGGSLDDSSQNKIIEWTSALVNIYQPVTITSTGVALTLSKSTKQPIMQFSGSAGSNFGVGLFGSDPGPQTWAVTKNDLLTKILEVSQVGQLTAGPTTAAGLSHKIISNLQVTWASPTATAGLVVGDVSATGGSFAVATASINTSFFSGLTVEGTYGSQISTVNVFARGVRSAGGYSSKMLLGTTYETGSVTNIELAPTYVATNVMTILGPSVTQNYLGQIHKISGSLAVATPSSPNSDEAGFFLLSSNLNQGSYGNRFSTSLGGAGILFDTRTGSTGFSITFYANLPTATAGFVAGGMDHTGAWYLGPASFAGIHTLNGYARIVSQVPAAVPAGNATLDCSTKHIFHKTGNGAITLSNLSEGQTVTVLITNNGTAYSWATAISWGTTAPAPVYTSGLKDVYTFIKLNGIIFGASILGST